MSDNKLMHKPSRSGLAHIIDAARYSLQGIAAAWKNETAFKQQLFLAACFSPGMFIFPQNLAEQLLMLVTMALVFLTEMLNSAIESVVDRVGTEHHALSGQAKDLGSAAVMIAMLLFAAVWLAIAWQWYQA